MKKIILFFSAIVVALASHQTIKLDEFIEDDVPALQDQGEVHKPQENIIEDEPIRPDEPKHEVTESLEEVEPINLAPPKLVENVKVTAYASCDSIPKRTKNYKKIRMRNGGGAGITASGEPAHEGGVAADKRYYPKGTVFYVPEIGKTLVVNDTGGKIKGRHHIDIYLDKYVDAIRWGKPRLTVWVMVAQK